MLQKRIKLFIVVTLLLMSVINVSFIEVSEADSPETHIWFFVTSSWFSVNLTEQIILEENIVSINGNQTINFQIRNDSMKVQVKVDENYLNIIKNDGLVEVNPLGTNNVTFAQNSESPKLILQVNGSITAKASASNNLTLHRSVLCWNDTGRCSLTISPAGMSDGDLINITLSELKYTVFAGLYLVNNSKTTEIMPFQEIGSFAGVPSSFSSSLVAVDPSATSLLVWSVAGALIVLTMLLFGMFIQKKRQLNNLIKKQEKFSVLNAKTKSVSSTNITPADQPIPPPILTLNRCQDCSAENSSKAKFCKNCGKKLP